VAVGTPPAAQLKADRRQLFPPHGDMVARGSYEDRPMSNMRPQIYLLPVAVFLSVLASMTAGDGMTMRYPLLSIASWLLAVVLVVAAVGGS